MKKTILFLPLLLLALASCTSPSNKKASNPDHQCLMDKDYKACQAKLDYFYRYNDIKKFKLLWSKVCTKKSFRAKCDSKMAFNREIANKAITPKKKLVFKFSTDTQAVRMFYIKK